MNYISSNTGKLPTIRGLDRGDSPDFGARALAWWNTGGIPMVGYHMGSPVESQDGYAGSQMNANINAALTPGTAEQPSRGVTRRATPDRSDSGDTSHRRSWPTLGSSGWAAQRHVSAFCGYRVDRLSLGGCR